MLSLLCTSEVSKVFRVNSTFGQIRVFRKNSVFGLNMGSSESVVFLPWARLQLAMFIQGEQKFAGKYGDSEFWVRCILGVLGTF